MYPSSMVILILYYNLIFKQNYYCTDIKYLYLTCSIYYSVIKYLDLRNVKKFKFKLPFCLYWLPHRWQHIRNGGDGSHNYSYNYASIGVLSVQQLAVSQLLWWRKVVRCEFVSVFRRNALYNIVSVTSSFTYLNIQIKISVLFLVNEAQVAAH
jgi:hypothetical protein